MNRGKNSRLKNTPGPKIDQMMMSNSRANEANGANANTSMETPAGTGTDPSIINEIRIMNHQDKIQQVGADVTTIKDCLDSLKSDVVGLNSRIGEAENRVSQLEDENAALAANTAELKSKVALLEDRIQYQENYSRRNNLRIKGIPERSEKGNNALECVMDVLRSQLPQDQNADQIVVERWAKHVSRTRHILVRFLRFADKEKIRLRAREIGSFQWRGNKLEFFPDFTKEVQEKRNKFFEVRRMCRAKGLKYTTQCFGSPLVRTQRQQKR
uniref:L1 transposable element RRM domain-containing protein n=1 Tax=Poecilia latipinna TaxID=48699 RepID=A0A3B3TJJ4_9TELE